MPAARPDCPGQALSKQLRGCSDNVIFATERDVENQKKLTALF